MAETATEDLYCDAARAKLVSGSSTDAAFLVARKGQPIPAEFADKVKQDKKPANKQASKPSSKKD